MIISEVKAPVTSGAENLRMDWKEVWEDSEILVVFCPLTCEFLQVDNSLSYKLMLYQPLSMYYALINPAERERASEGERENK